MNPRSRKPPEKTGEISNIQYIAEIKINTNIPIPSMGRLYIYLHIWLILMIKYGKCVGKYTSPMDASWDLNLTKDEYHEPL